MIVYPLGSSLIKPSDSILEAFTQALRRSRLELKTGDVVAVSSKVVATAENALVDSSRILPSKRARVLAVEHSLPSRFVQVVLDEADSVLGGVQGALLTIKDGDATANAGVDRKNAPKGTFVLWPRDSGRSAQKLRTAIQRRFRKRIGVIVVDSRVTPLRLGTIGFAIGTSGFRPVQDVRGEADLSGRRVGITFRAIADSLAATAQLVMGEASEKKPFAIIRGFSVRLGSDNEIGSAKLAPAQCLYMSQISMKDS
ncbi:MAG TPA: coenzyme F420-0:L-glutamate ligase [Candidatus Bathyarchaeia archaeon]|nr:coenzyme F420-0:L-glutamate ligase [Candidatus Bathyarchaeia archaeon]